MCRECRFCLILGRGLQAHPAQCAPSSAGRHDGETRRGSPRAAIKWGTPRRVGWDARLGSGLHRMLERERGRIQEERLGEE